MKLKYILAVALLLMFTASSSATSEDSSSDKTIAICPIEYTALGKAANWHLNYAYIVETNGEGIVEKVTKVEKGEHPNFAREDKMVGCIKTWKLSPSGKYTVVFSIGTHAGNGNSISIVDSKHNVIKLVLS